MGTAGAPGAAQEPSLYALHDRLVRLMFELRIAPGPPSGTIRFTGQRLSVEGLLEALRLRDSWERSSAACRISIRVTRHPRKLTVFAFEPAALGLLGVRWGGRGGGAEGAKVG